MAAQGRDADFLDALIDEIESTECVDRSRVYIAGFSAGAGFAGAYACARADRIAAIATVAVEFPGGCTRPLSITAFHGTADPIVPYGAMGPPISGAGTEANMAAWARVARCDPEPRSDAISDRVTRLTWANCAGGSAVVLHRLAGSGHVWPSNATGGLDATGVIIRFLADHRLQGVPAEH